MESRMRGNVHVRFGGRGQEDLRPRSRKASCPRPNTSIQARLRCHPTLGPASCRATRVEHEYDRGGSLAYLAAWDVHRAKVLG